MRIAFIAPRFDMGTGGGSHHTLDMMLRYFSDRAEVDLIVNGKVGRSVGTRYQTLTEDFNGSFFQTQRKIAEYLRAQEKKYDVYILYGPAFIWGGGMYRKRNGITTTVCYLNNYIPGIWPRRWSLHFVQHWFWEKTIGRFTIRGLDAIFCDSPVLCEQYRLFGFPAEKLRAVPEWVDVETIIEKGSSPPKDLSRPRLLYAGRFTGDKGVDVLVRAMPYILQHTDAAVDLIGSGPELPALRSLIEKLRLQSSVHIQEWVSRTELDRAYAQAALLVHPCRWIEPFGRTILEAMCYGVPVVTTAATGSSWVMGSAGVAIRSGDPALLADAVLALLNDKERYAAAADTAVRRSRLFDYRRIAKGFEQALIDLTLHKQLADPLFPELD